MPKDQVTQDVLEEIPAYSGDAPQPKSSLKIKDVLHKGEGQFPSEVVVSLMKDAGWVFIYDTETREQSICNKNMLKQQLSPRRPDGTRIFTLQKPDEPPWRGRLTCWLHEERPERESYNGLGLPICNKANLAAEMHVLQHVKRKHPTSYEIIQHNIAQAEKAEEREFRKNLMTAAGNVALNDTVVSVACTNAGCGQIFSAKTAMIANNKLKEHRKTRKVEA